MILSQGDLKLEGLVFGRLTVISDTGSKNSNRAKIYLCQCSCGNQKSVVSVNLRNGHTKSCGCWHKEAPVKHGLESNRFYSTWHSMIARCYKPNCKAYKNYGARGITVCSEWKDAPTNFIKWAEENYPLTGNFELDRENNNLGYFPTNCRFITKKEQNRNKRSNIYINSPWGNMLAKDVAEKLKIKYRTLLWRIKNKTEESWFLPVKGNN